LSPWQWSVGASLYIYCLSAPPKIRSFPPDQTEALEFFDGANHRSRWQIKRLRQFRLEYKGEGQVGIEEKP